MTHPKHDIIRKHLQAYEQEGVALQMEAKCVASLRRRVTDANAVHLDLGQLRPDGAFAPDDSWREYASHAGPIVLTAADAKCRTMKITTRYGHEQVKSVGADCDIVYPGMQACLLVWLDGWAARVEAARVAWAARDAVAEAVALGEVQS